MGKLDATLIAFYAEAIVQEDEVDVQSSNYHSFKLTVMAKSLGTLAFSTDREKNLLLR